MQAGIHSLTNLILRLERQTKLIHSQGFLKIGCLTGCTLQHYITQHDIIDAIIQTLGQHKYLEER